MPGQQPERIETLLEEHVKKHSPKGVTVEFRRGHGGNAYVCDPNSEFGLAAQQALEEAFGRKPVLVREGGSIPIIEEMKRVLGADALMLGMCLPDARIHSPNENFPVDLFSKGIDMTFKTGLGKPVVHAVRGIDMNIRQGEVYGLIGPNGSGKSTLMKALLGLVRPTEGSCSIFGRSSLAPDSKEEVGFLPENPYFYKFLTGAETVSFYGRLCGLSGKSLKAKVRELLELVGLADAADRRLGGYSKGMLQRIGMAQALVQSPRLLVLDEPTAGVDPLGSRDIRNIIENLKGRGMTVFLCSHLLEQVQEVCDRVGVIFKGLLIAEGSVNELTRDSDKQEILLEHASPELMERLKDMVKEDGHAVWLEDGHPRNSLESVFLKSLLEWKEKHPNPEP